MTKEEIINMAREAGVFEVSYPHPAGNMVEVERFAALVAAAEREACAAVCREDWVELKGWDMATAEVIRKAIRARGSNDPDNKRDE